MNHSTDLLDTGLRATLNEEISHFSGSACSIQEVSVLGGGSISRALVLHGERSR